MASTFSIVICTGRPDDPKSVQNWWLARTLAERGHAVELVCDGGRHDLGDVHDGITVSTWPSPVPGRPRDFFFHRLVRRVRPDVVIRDVQSVNAAMPVGWTLGVRHRIAWHRSLSTQTPSTILAPAPRSGCTTGSKPRAGMEPAPVGQRQIGGSHGPAHEAHSAPTPSRSAHAAMYSRSTRSPCTLRTPAMSRRCFSEPPSR